MRTNIVAVTMSEARSAGQRVLDDGGDRIAVARATMEAARGGFMAPDEGEAFSAAIGALWELYPDDDSLRSETRAIGDRNKMMQALINGVPVDMEAWQPEPIPDDALGLIELWKEVAA